MKADLARSSTNSSTQSSPEDLSELLESFRACGIIIESNCGFLEELQDYFQSLEQRLIALETLHQNANYPLR
jgi:thiamine pyrophosphate-dependent acetolactate synthase large subunit-like protein